MFDVTRFLSLIRQAGINPLTPEEETALYKAAERQRLRRFLQETEVGRKLETVAAQLAANAELREAFESLRRIRDGKPVADRGALVIREPRPASPYQSALQTEPLATAAQIQSALFVAAGGNAPGQNASFKALASGILEAGVHFTAVKGGIAELAQENPTLWEMNTQEVARIDELESSLVVGTTRSDEKALPQIVKNLRAINADVIFIQGGDGTQTLARILYEEYGLPVIGLVKTLDGNVAMEMADGRRVLVSSIGFTTVVDRTMEYIDRLSAQAHRERKLIVLEVSGRETGWIAMTAARRRGVPYFIEEDRPTLDRLIQTGQGFKGRGGVIVVSESVEFFDDQGIKIPLKNLRTGPLPMGPEKILEQALIAKGLTARGADLSILSDTSDSKMPDQVDRWLHQLRLSASSQNRLNLVRIPRSIFNQLAVDDNPSVRFLGEPHYFSDPLTDQALHQFKEGVRLMVLPDGFSMAGYSFSVEEQKDNRGRLRYQTRFSGPTVAQFLAHRVGMGTAFYVAGDLLMAEVTSPAELEINRRLGRELARRALSSRKRGYFLAPRVGDGKILASSLHRIRNVKVHEAINPDFGTVQPALSPAPRPYEAPSVPAAPEEAKPAIIQPSDPQGPMAFRQTPLAWGGVQPALRFSSQTFKTKASLIAALQLQAGQDPSLRKLLRRVQMGQASAGELRQIRQALENSPSRLRALAHQLSSPKSSFALSSPFSHATRISMVRALR